MHKTAQATSGCGQQTGGVTPKAPRYSSAGAGASENRQQNSEERCCRTFAPRPLADERLLHVSGLHGQGQVPLSSHSRVSRPQGHREPTVMATSEQQETLDSSVPNKALGPRVGTPC